LGHSTIATTQKYLHAKPDDSSGLYLEFWGVRGGDRWNCLSGRWMSENHIFSSIVKMGFFRLQAEVLEAHEFSDSFE
jgi:hypothetical protein